MNYNSIQCLSLSVGTGSPEPIYHGNQDDTLNWQHRIAFMKKSIKTAQCSKKLTSNPSCLKIFMAPEFFFRSSKGAYALETASKISEELIKMVKHEKYKDWLFVFGTTVAYYENNLKSEIKYDVLNFSLIQKGNGDEKDSYLVVKRYLSTIDFLKESDNPNALLDKNIQYISNNNGILDEKRIANYDGTCFFEIDGIKFGVEICSDNLAHRIDHSNIKDSIDVLLIPSCGRPNPTLSKKLSETGIMFSVDGAHSGKSKVEKAGSFLFFNQVKMKEILKIEEISEFYSDAKISISKPIKFQKKEIRTDILLSKKQTIPEKKNPVKDIEV